MASRFIRPSTRASSTSTTSTTTLPPPLHADMSPHSFLGSPPPTDYALSIPSDGSASYASATARQEMHQRRPKRFDAPQPTMHVPGDAFALPHDKFFKAEYQKTQAKKQSRRRDWRIAAALFAWACFIRFWHIWEPSSVVFDEVHFGGFASKYIKTRFFMDVHPPLAKMLIALVAKLAGFDGRFEFKNIGDEYIEAGVPYVTMRCFCALTGALTVPVAYWSIRGCGHSVAAGIVAALMVCYDNGLIANNRLILLDPPLLLFITTTALMWINFQNQEQRPFRFWWWTWLTLTGLGLGLTVSCKLVGLFTIATVGFSTIFGLWRLWGNDHVSLHQFGRHFMARAMCLIALPITIYLLMFQIHFHSLPNSGEGDGFMSPAFQQTLDGHHMQDTPIDIAYGSKVFIRHIATRGGYLHSHPHNYETGSNQQQITLYPHQDDNNWWTIYKRDTEKVEEVEFVRNGDVIRLMHSESNKRLHSHNHRPPMTDQEYHNEVSGYGFPDFEGDANDLWRVEIVEHDKKDALAGDQLRTLHSKFRLIHVMENCALFSHSVKLPDWAYGQQEVTCIKDGKLPKTMWYVESTVNDLLPADTEKVNYERPGFFGKFIELNQVMWDVNKGLTDSHPYDSRPQDWPFLRRGINFWGKDFKTIYLLGNPLVYWSASVAVFSYFAVMACLLLLDKRGVKTEFRGLRAFYERSSGFFVSGWFLHYFPFFLMGRQLFLHHYMPSLYFSILTFAVAFDLVTIRLVQRKRLVAAFAWLMVIVYAYRCFVPVTYGEPWTKTQCEQAKWRSTWDFDCNVFHDRINEYSDHQAIDFKELGNSFDKVKDAINGYMGQHRELAPEVAEIVNLISDGIKQPDTNPSNKEDDDANKKPSPTDGDTKDSATNGDDLAEKVPNDAQKDNNDAAAAAAPPPPADDAPAFAAAQDAEQ